MKTNELTVEEFNLLRDLIYKKTGINYTENKKIILQNRIRRRLRALSFQTYGEYYNFIKNKPDSHPEMKEFYNEITTNETSFFRHDRQFDALQNMVIPEVVEISKSRNIHIWSAAASKGKEAYSIAMVLKAMTSLHSYKIDILGTDLNEDVLSIAKAGEYPIKELEDIPHSYQLYLKINKEEEKFVIRDEIKKEITFKKFNLMESFSSLPTFNIIFCRNVFIYFEKATQREIVHRMYDKLVPGGFFILGHSETLSGVTERFTYRKFNKENLMIYQKPMT